MIFFFQAEDGIRDLVRSRGLGDVYKRQAYQYVHADQHAMAWAPSNSNIVYLGNDGGIYRSDNKGENWTSLNNNLFITQFYYGAVNPVSYTHLTLPTSDLV